MLTSRELEIVIIIGALTFGIIILNLTRKEPVQFWSPLTMVSLIFFYYVVIGPILAIRNSQTYFRLVDHREYIINAWKLSLLGLTGIIIGFLISGQVKYSPASLNETDFPDVKKHAQWLFFIGLGGLVIFVGLGGVINQLTFWDIYSIGRRGYTGAFKNYFLHAIDFFIPSLILYSISFWKKKTTLIWILLFLFIAISIYAKQGFRWRYVVLGLGLVMTYYINAKKRPSTIFLIIISIVGILAMGVIGLSRYYGRGLNLAKIEGRTNEEIFIEGFSEASIFMTTGLLVDKVPRDFKNIGFDPVIQTLMLPVPRILWPGKETGDYISTYENLYGSKQLGYGTAVINFGEYYLAFGFYGVFLGGFLIGYGYKRFWIWFLGNSENPYAITLYSVGVSFLYVIISRGYLPQVTMLFFFTVFPAYILFRINQRNTLKRNLFKPPLNTGIIP